MFKISLVFSLKLPHTFRISRYSLWCFQIHSSLSLFFPFMMLLHTFKSVMMGITAHLEERCMCHCFDLNLFDIKLCRACHLTPWWPLDQYPYHSLLTRVANNYLVTSNSSWASKLTEESTFTKCTRKDHQKKTSSLHHGPTMTEIPFQLPGLRWCGTATTVGEKDMQPYVHKENTALLCFPLTVTQMSCKTATTQDIYLHHDGLGEGLKTIYSTTCLKNCIAANTAVI